MNRVLIVDDEKSLRVTLAAFLNHEGIEADSAANTAEAYFRMAEKNYDVILTDIIMPRESGIDMMSKIRQTSSKVQIIVMTGEPTVETAVKAVQNGANDYLTKPISKENLLKAIRQACRIKSLSDEKDELERQNQLYRRDLEQQVFQRTQALQGALRGTIFLLSSMLDVRDPYTGGHQRRVGNLAAAIALRMNMDAMQVNYIRTIGYIHDIGKMLIPTEILSRPGKLTSLELEMVHGHAQYGYEMLQKARLPEFIAQAVYQHHERFDGSGYPRGLKGPEIMTEAKIIVVADVVEAMMSHRPYRPALGKDAALKEIEGNAGRLYDEEAVKACLWLLGQNDYMLEDVEYDVCFPV